MGHATPLFPISLSVVLGVSIPRLSSLAFQKHINCPVSQVDRWGGTVAQKELYLECHPYLIRRHLDETLDSELLQEWRKTFAAVGMGWIILQVKM